MAGRFVDQYAQIHATKPYGTTSIKNFRQLAAQIAAAPFPVDSIIDFGCGQSVLVDHLADHADAVSHRYDPAIPGFSEKPKGVFDILLNTDVLEHIPEDEIDALLAEMRKTCRHALFIIDLRPAKEILPNGDNAHCSQFPAPWWRARLLKHFDIVEPITVQHKGRAAFRTWNRTPAGHATYGIALMKLALHPKRLFRLARKLSKRIGFR